MEHTRENVVTVNVVMTETEYNLLCSLLVKAIRKNLLSDKELPLSEIKAAEDFVYEE